MSNFVTILRLVIQLLPVVIEAIKAVEAAVPQGGQGTQKLEMVRGILQSAYDVAGNLEATFDQLWPVLRSAISGVVSVYNAAGTFKK